MNRSDQLETLTSDVVRDYSAGRIAWTQIRHRLGVTDYDLVLFRLGQEGLRVPRADPARSDLGLQRLRTAMEAHTGAAT